MIFLIDGDASVRKALARVLKSAGHPVAIFTSARAFQEHYRPATPGCLVVDIELPRLSGLDLQQLTVGEYHLPIVIVTSHGDIPMRVRAMKAGAVEFLTKPFAPQALLGAVERALTAKVPQRVRAEDCT
jgi:FixJ family two-component response regulator